jgi:HTH-type transcriptional regulator/antitoxin HigA
MKTVPSKKRKSRTCLGYLALIAKFPLRPIRTAAEHERAMEMIRLLAIWDEGTLSPDEQDYLDTLVMLLEAHSRDHAVKMPKISGLERLKFLMEQHNMNVSQLGKIVGGQPLASMILSGKREMSKEVMHRLGKHFDLEPGAFF